MDGGHGGWQVLFAALVCLSTLSGAAGGGLAAPTADVVDSPATATTGETETASLVHSVSLADAEDAVLVRVTLQDVPGLKSFTFDVPPGTTVRQTDGFEERSGRWYWDGSPSEPTLVYELPVDEPGDARLRGPDWAVVAHLETRISWTASRDVTVEQRLEGVDGYAGNVGVAVGNVTVRPFAAGGERSTVVVPAALAGDVDVAEVGTLTTDLARWFPAGEANDRTNVFLLPSDTDFGAPGVVIGGGDFLVSAWLAGGDGDVEPGVFAHEYTHTRQSFHTESGMAWFTEGSARYYENRYLLERGDRSFGPYRRFVSVESEAYANATLSEVHPTSTAAYQKGAHVLTALDVLMRQRTDGKARLGDLLDRANAHDGRVSYADFRSMVRAEAGPGLDGWLDLYVRGRGVPELPENASLVAPVGWESGEAPGNLYVCVDGEWWTRPEALSAGEPVQVFDATYAVTRFSNAERVDGWTGPCDADALPVATSKYGEPTPRRYVFEGDTTLTFRSAYDPTDVTTVDVAVVDRSTPTSTRTATSSPTPASTPAAADTGGDDGSSRTATVGRTGTVERTDAATEGTRSTAEPAEVDAPPLVVEPRASGLLVRRGAVTALFPLPVLVWLVGFLACIAGGTYLLLRE
jgi:hypothetical protein